MAYNDRGEMAAQVGRGVQIRPVGNRIPPDGRIVDEQGRGRRSMLWAISGRLIIPPEKRYSM